MKLEFQALGTSWTIDINETISGDKKANIYNIIKAFEQTYSRFVEKSFVTIISNTTGEFIIPPDGQTMFDLYFKLYKVTNGLFTPLIGQNLIQAGYDKDYSLKPEKLSRIPSLPDAVEYTFPILTIRKPVQFDLGGVGKGYLIDIVGEYLQNQVVDSFTIDAGGDILHYSKSHTQIKIGLEHPLGPEKVIGTTDIVNKSICASSINRRNWGQFNHIINPQKLKSPTEILSTWVIADEAIIADSIATALFLVPSEKLTRYYECEYLILYSDFRIEKSEGFNADLYNA